MFMHLLSAQNAMPLCWPCMSWVTLPGTIYRMPFRLGRPPTSKPTASAVGHAERQSQAEGSVLTSHDLHQQQGYG